MVIRRSSSFTYCCFIWISKANGINVIEKCKGVIVYETKMYIPSVFIPPVVLLLVLVAGVTIVLGGGRAWQASSASSNNGTVLGLLDILICWKKYRKKTRDEIWKGIVQQHSWFWGSLITWILESIAMFSLPLFTLIVMNACTKGGKCCDNHRKIGPAKKGLISKRVYQSI